jgi:hypothetical protein
MSTRSVLGDLPLASAGVLMGDEAVSLDPAPILGRRNETSSWSSLEPRWPSEEEPTPCWPPLDDSD